ncbi:immediate early response gene 5 protein-like [Pollicipes pollicipes]|uniref:immediate early response gene 5 protein-like n=1 Tax=Pollicipes pollicipes TaxID=41117 RepID=UPI0018853430|nr:immediate early response gene 5 protein-like [Pollicipes pollicipes]
MEAQRVISVSLGKIAQSRVQRSGCSLHKSLMVASILQKARHLYVEQAFMMHCRPPVAPPAAAPAPPPPADRAPVYTDLDECGPAGRGVGGVPEPAEAAEPSEPARRKRLISDEETEEAVASILPKRARIEPDPPSKDADSDDSDDSCYESGDSDDSEADAMEIDRITSLVSVFSFDSLKLRRAAPEPWELSAADPVAVRA